MVSKCCSLDRVSVDAQADRSKRSYGSVSTAASGVDTAGLLKEATSVVPDGPFWCLVSSIVDAGECTRSPAVGRDLQSDGDKDPTEIGTAAASKDDEEPNADAVTFEHC